MICMDETNKLTAAEFDATLNGNDGPVIQIFEHSQFKIQSPTRHACSKTKKFAHVAWLFLGP